MSQKITMEDLKNRLQQHQHKLTKQRSTVLDVFVEHSGEHLSAEDVYDILRSKSVDIGLATIYRSLELLAELAILQKVEFGDGCSRYEICSTEPDAHQHHHLICLSCGKIQEVADDMLDELENDVAKKSGFKITDHQVKLFGYCRECQKL